MMLLAAVVAAGLGAADEQDPTGNQDQPIGGLTFVDRVEVTIANLAVYVTDKKGRAVTDLQAEDFQVFQNGVKKQISNFKLYTDEVIQQQFVPQPGLANPLAAPTPVPVAGEGGGPRPVHFVIYIDNQNLEPLDRNRVLSQAREFISSSLHPPAQMMVVAYQRSFEVLQTFTSDPNEVLAAVRSVRRYTGGRPERINAKRDIIDRIKEIEDGRSSSADRRLGNQWMDVERAIENYAREEINDLQFALDALRQVIGSLAGLPGKKGILYISNGLPMIPGQELYYELSRVSNSQARMIEMFEFDRTRQFQQLANLANSQDVAFYTIDASGLDVGDMGSAEYAHAQEGMTASIGRSNLTDSLRLLADETGGIAIINTNDVAPKLELVRQDMFTYYSIGYPLQASGNDKVHKVVVKLRDDPAFKSYQLRYRTRFVEKSLETRVQDRVVSSLAFEVIENPIDVDVEIGEPTAASEGRWLVPAKVSFPIANVALLPEGDDYVGRIVMFVAVRDDEGKRSDLVRQDHEVRVASADYERAQRHRWNIGTQLLMESGRYKIAVAILDPVTRQHSYKTIAREVNPDG
jgi:VWFA-related protein